MFRGVRQVAAPVAKLLLAIEDLLKDMIFCF